MPIEKIPMRRIKKLPKTPKTFYPSKVDHHFRDFDYSPTSTQGTFVGTTEAHRIVLGRREVYKKGPTIGIGFDGETMRRERKRAKEAA
jgi:hypothetical protein